MKASGIVIWQPSSILSYHVIPILYLIIAERNSKNSKLTAETQNQNTSTATPTDTGAGAQELAAAVDDLLDQLQHKFDKVSTEIFGKCEYSPPPYLHRQKKKDSS